MSTLSNNLVFLRKKRGLSQAKAAKLISISRPAYGAYEEARNEPSIDVLINISTGFDVSIDDLCKVDLKKKEPSPALLPDLSLLNSNFK